MENHFKTGMLLAITLLLVAAFVWLMMGQTQREQHQSQQLQALTQEISRYTQEMEDIEDDLQDRKHALDQNLIPPTVSLCFQIRQPSDLQWVEERFASLGWPLTIVCSLDQPDLLQVVSWASQSPLNLELMFSHFSTYQQSPSILDQIRQQATKAGLSISPLWFLTQEEFTHETLDLLKQHGEAGFSQPTTYSLSIQSGVTEDDLLYVEHVPVQAGDNKVQSSLVLTIEQEKCLILLFDVAYLRETEQSDTFVQAALDTLTSFEQDGQLVVDTTRTYYDLAQQQEQSQQEQQKEYEAYAAQQRKRLDELQKKIDEIYESWQMEQ